MKKRNLGWKYTVNFILNNIGNVGKGVLPKSQEQELLFENYIGKYLENSPTDNEEKLIVFQKPWMPPLFYKFPVSDKKNLSFQLSVDQYSRLVFLNIAKLFGVICYFIS